MQKALWGITRRTKEFMPLRVLVCWRGEVCIQLILVQGGNTSDMGKSIREFRGENVRGVFGEMQVVWGG